jgi:microcystin-dependent protein
MADTPFIGEIRLMSSNFAPSGWAMCAGQTMPINQNQPLFSLLGTMYGGDGRTTFRLPDLQGQVPMHRGGNHPNLGEAAGRSSHNVSLAELPAHTHLMDALKEPGTVANPSGALLASANNLYRPPGDLAALHPSSVTNIGGGQPHYNMQPYLVLTYCIALVGIFPSQN